MSDSQRFPVAAHALAYLAHRGAYAAERAVRLDPAGRLVLEAEGVETIVGAGDVVHVR